MDAFLLSTITIAIAEIGDKTQLLSLLLAARFKRPMPIIAGIVIATVVNHGLSAWLGTTAAALVPPEWQRWIVALSFFAVAAWVLIPDNDDEETGRFDRYGPLLATIILFFLAEIGDKTQIATVLLAAEYQNVLLVTTATTLGMVLANVPVVLAGDRIMRRIPLHVTRLVAALLFALLGVFALLF